LRNNSHPILEVGNAMQSELNLFRINTKYGVGIKTSIFNTVLLLLWTFFALSIPLHAQGNDLKFEHFSIEDGLSHSKVNCIFQDDRGFLWVGTNDGLNKFDGYEFTVYRWKPNDPQGLSAQLGRAVMQDRKGNLWIGTEAVGSICSIEIPIRFVIYAGFCFGNPDQQSGCQCHY
jgi:hypothetical protein